MTAEGLNVVLEAGRESRFTYYEQRADEFGSKQRRSLAKLFKSVQLGESLNLEDIMGALTEEYGSEQAKTIFHQALYRGVLYRRRGDYAIPIPSMHDWLVSNYASK